MRIVLSIAALVLLQAAPTFAEVNQEMIDRVAAGEITEARASWWGFDREDATEALQAAINSGAETLIVEDMGSPWIVTPIELASNQEIVFEEGVEILAKRGEFKGRGDSLFTARDIENVTLRGYGATFRMWQEDYANPDLYEPAEWRMALALRGVTDVTVLGLTLRDSGGDGIYLGRGSGGKTNLNVHIKDVICDNNYRQGISVITGENVLIEDTIMRDTSGTAPQAGIDFEPNGPQERIKNFVMRNCLTENNNSSGYMFYLGSLNADSEPLSIRIEGCRSVNDHGSAVQFSVGGTLESAVGGTVEFIDCVFESSRGAGINISKPARQGALRFERCAVLNTAGDSGALSPIVFGSRTSADTPVGGVEFVDVVVRDLPDRPLMRYGDQAGGIPVEDITGNIILIDEAGERTDLQLTDERLAEWMPETAIVEIPRLGLEGVRLIPLEADPPIPVAEVRWPIIRKTGEHLLHAEAGDEVSFIVNHLQVGSYGGGNMPVTVTAPSGEVVLEAAAPFKQETPIRFVPPETGVYTITGSAGGNRYQLKDASHPLVVNAGSGAVSFIEQEKDLVFYVPEGTEEFGVRVYGQGAGEALAATLIDPAGDVFGQVDNQFGLHQFHVQKDEPSSGEVWMLQIRKPSDSTWEDHFVDLRGIPPLLAPAGAPLLIPAAD
ncbi:MAG: right-handed parallel beta-helix repeat-containing protein [Armatimonadota bacterium]